MLIVVRRLCGHELGGPTGVADQSSDRIRLPISPPATNRRSRSTAAGTRLTSGILVERCTDTRTAWCLGFASGYRAPVADPFDTRSCFAEDIGPHQMAPDRLVVCSHTLLMSSVGPSANVVRRRGGFFRDRPQALK